MDIGAVSMGVGLGSLWVMEDPIDRKLLVRISAATGDEEARITLPEDGAGVWVSMGESPRSKELYRIILWPMPLHKQFP